jgi:Cu2+-exporting ATPase
VFDKTGTLTLGRPRLVGSSGIYREAIGIAAALASHSRHPYSRALVEAAADLPPSRIIIDEICEHPGLGLEARSGATTYRLGRPEWALAGQADAPPTSGDGSVVLSRGETCLAEFCFEDFLRADALKAVTELSKAGLLVQVVSGDREAAVAPIARQLGAPYFAAVMPAGKIAHIAALEASGRKVLMVGDGLNDTPALVAAHASMAPASAADLGRNAADLVFLRESLSAVPQAVCVARNARRLVRQNFALAIAYNLVAIPVAIMGYVTPLVAAATMSASSMLVVANALRLSSPRKIAPRAVAEPQRSAKAAMEAAE